MRREIQTVTIWMEIVDFCHQDSIVILLTTYLKVRRSIHVTDDTKRVHASMQLYILVHIGYAGPNFWVLFQL